MKIIKSIFVSLMLYVIVKGNMLGAAIRGTEPIILSFGAALVASGLDSRNTKDVNHFVEWDGIKEFFKPWTDKLKEVGKEVSL